MVGVFKNCRVWFYNLENKDCMSAHELKKKAQVSRLLLTFLLRRKFECRLAEARCKILESIGRNELYLDAKIQMRESMILARCARNIYQT